MASSQPQFQLTVHHCLTPNKDRHLSKIGFMLQIRTFLEDDWQGDSQDQFVLPEFVFGSDGHRNYVNRRLLEAGWVDQGSLERILDIAFSDGKSILEKENKNGFDNMVMIIFRVKRIVMRGDDEIAATAAMELSMREDPKLIPATKESIQALTKAKLGEGDGDGDGDGFKCVICMEKLGLVWMGGVFTSGKVKNSGGGEISYCSGEIEYCSGEIKNNGRVCVWIQTQL